VGCLPTGVAIGGGSKEFEKALGAAVIDGRALLSLDNMEQPIQGQLLCQVLSQQRAEVRVLGPSKITRPSTSVAIFTTGNNLEVKGDMTRRILICKLDARKEHPEHRTFDGDLIAEIMPVDCNNNEDG
jgi:putative DNA primase/helicase